MKYCFSISTYDAIDDLHMSADLIRSNWNNSHDLFIVAGLCKNETTSLINLDLIDAIKEIETPDSPCILNDENIKICSRLFNSIIKTGQLAIANHCDYIIYLNSGSWVLDPNDILKIINELGDRTFAVQLLQRMKWVIPDDHFLIVNLKKATEQGLYHHSINYHSRPYNPLTISMNGIHGMLMCWLTLAPYGDIYVYSNHDKSVNEFGSNHIYSLNPLIFNTEYRLLHSNRQFEYLNFIRRKYIEKYVQKKSKRIQKYLSDESQVPRGYTYFDNPMPHYKKHFS